jgi:dipeptidyl aminopeptidase/acylaminoacyl peptidase
MNSRRQELLIRTCARFALFLCAAGTAWSTDAAETNARPPFSPADVFELEFASDPQISPDGSQVAYLRNSIDIMTDKVRSRLWIVGVDGREHRPLTDPNVNTSSPRWSPDGKRLAYAARGEKATQVFVRWMDSGQTARLTNVTESPGEFVWSPDGQQLAFSMLFLDKRKPHFEMPAKPEGAAWAEPFKLYDTLVYRDDGRGYVKEGFYHLFVLPADGGTPRQITSGSFHHRERPAWTADGKSLVFAANRRDDWEYEPLDSDLYRVTIADGAITQLTDRRGTDASPVVSPDGRKIAFVGFDDAGRSHHQIDLYVMSLDGTDRRCLTSELDRDVADPSFAHDGKGIFFQYDDEGNTRVGYVSLATGKTAQLAADVGGVNFGRPYASGSYSAAYNGRIAFTQTDPTRPADVATAVAGDSTPRRLTHLNDDLLPHRELGRVESFRYKSSYDQQPMHGWIVTPPGFDPQKQYPLILEIHGGPFANYGGRFSVEMQLYAAAGYVVVYVNPRGSTSYGDAFTAFIDHNYPSHDYDDLMSGVDAVIARGYVDPNRLYVTGGSGGGILSSWIIGKTDRFQAAAVIKPVINWYSFALTSDHYNFFARYWFGKNPWEDPEAYLKRSPLSLVGNVKTPTLLMTGEVDYRTPISEAEQFYQALKLRKIDTVLVRVPDSSHDIGARPSQMIAKCAYILKWFEKHPGRDK